MGLMRNRSFLLVFTGMAVSLLGDALYALTLPLWVLDATGSAGAVALLNGLGSVTSLLLAPLAGTIADRTDRRHIMIAADLVRALAVGAAAIFMLTGRASFGHVLAVGALLSGASVFFTPAYAASQSGLVHPEDLTRSLSLFQMMRQIVAMAGPSLAGVVVAGVGAGPALGLDAATFGISAVAIALARLRWAPRPPRERRPFWADFRTGISTIADHPVLRRTVVLTCGVNAAGAMFGVLLPVIARQEWHLSAQQYGLWGTASPAGIMLGLTLVTAVANRIRFRGRFMLLALLGMGVTNLAMAWGSGFWPFTVLLFLGGLTFGLSNVMFAALYRVLVPQEQQGRFFGMLGSVNQALQPVGAALAGLLADQVSPFLGAAVAGSIVVALAVWGLTGPGLRDVE
ncbi:MAG: multidrug resistance protein [Symbiobacteriaceae bacterium]|jgi:MFS family permease|nr:multidrug resistance protein [Symbiobacteriaceae bacterium]